MKDKFYILKTLLEDIKKSDSPVKLHEDEKTFFSNLKFEDMDGKISFFEKDNPVETEELSEENSKILISIFKQYSQNIHDKIQKRNTTAKGRMEYWIKEWCKFQLNQYGKKKNREDFKDILKERGLIIESTNELTDEQKDKIANQLYIDMIYFNSAFYNSSFL